MRVMEDQGAGGGINGSSTGFFSPAAASRVKDAVGASERSDVLDAAVGRGARLEGAQNNNVVLGRPRQAPSPLPPNNPTLGLDKEHHI